MPPVLAPQNTGDDAGAVTEDGGTAASAAGVISVTDADDNNSDLDFFATAVASTAATAGSTANHAEPADPTDATDALTFADVSGTPTATVTGTYGDFTLTRDDSGETLSWSYALKAAAQALAGGQQAFEKLAVKAVDDSNNPGLEIITVTITGANDVPAITSAVVTETIWTPSRPMILIP